MSHEHSRIASIDLLRGLIMLIMALDHVRDYFHESAILSDPTDLTTTTAGLFMTRWITHFCAPVFLFLSGVSAYISGLRRSRAELTLHLITRGLWLIAFEIIVMTLILTFNVHYNLIFLLVLWAIGWSMIILGVLIRFSYRTVVVAGLVLFLGHNLTDFLNIQADGPGSILWNIFLTTPGSFYSLGQAHGVVIGYAILPWTAIMLLGYAAGRGYEDSFNPVKRRRLLRLSGGTLILLFIVLRMINYYGDPRPWSLQENWVFSVLSFINTTKYPVSLQFSCMTLGPALLVLSITEQVRTSLSRIISSYGRVPFFYYAGHFLIAHLLCAIVFFASGYTSADIVDPASPFYFRPSEFGFGLLPTYAFWVAVILLMYAPCRWFGRLKQTHRKPWLRYL